MTLLAEQEPAAPAPAAPPKPKKVRTGLASLLARFSGWPATTLKILALGLLDALVISSIIPLVTGRYWLMLAFLIVASLTVNIVFLMPARPSWIPPKYIVPGAIFLVGFSLVPIIYTSIIAFTNYGTGHSLSKVEAIHAIQLSSLTQPANGDAYTTTIAKARSGEYVMLLTSQSTGKSYIGTTKGLTPVPKSLGKRDADGNLVSIPGYTSLTPDQASAISNELQALTVPTANGGIKLQAIDVATDLVTTLKYNPKNDTMVDTTNGTVYVDNGKGSFINPKLTKHQAGYELLPGWKTWVGFKNFTGLITNPLVRGPFLQVLVWNFVFAFMSVLTTFIVGLALALVLNRKLRGQRAYRSILILPYAIPAFLSILVWSALLNDNYGAINTYLNINIPWLTDGTWAKVSILIVNLWLGMPYMFLVCTGALQSIPADLTEAASVDGARPMQSFRKVTLPLLLVAVGPLLVSSFAFNFNNFNLIYLLTGGGPPITNSETIAGQTDILISYTYNLAFTGGKGQQYGLAAAVSILIFFIVASVSLVAFRRTRVLEDVNR